MYNVHWVHHQVLLERLLVFHVLLDFTPKYLEVNRVSHVLLLDLLLPVILKLDLMSLGELFSLSLDLCHIVSTLCSFVMFID